MGELIFGVQNQSFIDSYWSVVHFSSGILVGIILLLLFNYINKDISGRNYSRYGFITLLVWEYFEMSLRFMEKYDIKLAQYLKIILPEDFLMQESITNILSDLILGSFGLFLVYQYTQKKKSRLDEKDATLTTQ